jgi:anti-sigma factor RsiW
MMNWAAKPPSGVPDAHPKQSAPQEDLALLLSLALDDRLDEREAAQLAALLATEPAWEAEWQTWQALDATLRSVPAVAPPDDFWASVENRLVQVERRRQLWTGTVIGLVAVLLWGGALIGAVSLGALVVANQGIWLNEVLHNMALWWIRLTTMVEVMWTAAVALLATPQAWAIAICYALAAAVVLSTWFGFLRRSVRSSAVMAAS